ncbi:hypothetical protein I545_3192 [Mycobacterium kansasii 662]|uniref:Uncharacterized protein n=2 Tax=Mycobacterium kansasii TaxID=1768 RepID=A0A1V3XMN5_MYCKA|nr:hypothetical protein I547_3231 [Mycobacterium kansasii 824]EUA17728.1 hypothetical protein I545_3192 [Mycobacterium kansasii 662]KEP39545.1 hypothetical protein MKSMC1_52960 [Mycobacterium kansasii]OOK80483.1 hypothetical protein BZL29_2919 [Mycobacterium kansasii]
MSAETAASLAVWAAGISGTGSTFSQRRKDVTAPDTLMGSGESQV